jgi:inosine/xanthosine triphosphate pyrophosphatase family protein
LAIGTVPADKHQELMGKRGRDYVLHGFVCFRFYSYVEMGTKQKNGISHRGRALDMLRAYLQQAQDLASAVSV